MSGMPDAFVAKFNLWICKSYVNDCYCMGVKVNPTLVMACSSPLRQMSFNPLHNLNSKFYSSLKTIGGPILALSYPSCNR